MQPQGEGWEAKLPLAEPGFFKAKAYLLDSRGWQYWPQGPDVGISVHPDFCRSGNIIYCAFTRLFGSRRALAAGSDPVIEAQLGPYDAHQYTVIPPSGKLRDLTRTLPHIFGTLGCRILQLLPVHPTPTTYARFGRYGSPYAALDMTAIDPALVEFDRRTTGIDQFRELTYASHLLGGRVFLDIVINHTGWGSVLHENHPEWFMRHPDGTFASPGAWGTTWEDLVELRHHNVQLWDELSEMFLAWCHRGVDGFRCDAGYKVPVDAWRYIIARVQEEFPQTVFLLEGLGGAWEATESLLTEGGMQWAYSELFQNYSPADVHNYLRHSFGKSRESGLLVHYSETHDNERLASKGRAWAVLRNRLCALNSVSGGFGFTCGVEWLATEKIRVHGNTGLNWGAARNIMPELECLNRLLNEHPCFRDTAVAELLTPHDSPVLAVRRYSTESDDELLVLANTDVARSQSLPLNVLKSMAHAPRPWTDLLGQTVPPIGGRAGLAAISLSPGAAYCLANNQPFTGLGGAEYRRLRGLAAFATETLALLLPAGEIDPPDWRELAQLVNRSPSEFLAAVSSMRLARDQGLIARADITELRHAVTLQQMGHTFPNVLEWTMADESRVMPVPPAHWVLVQDSVPFRCSLSFGGQTRSIQKQSVQQATRHAACFPPGSSRGEAILRVERYSPDKPAVQGTLLFLDEEPTLSKGRRRPKPSDTVLLTNRRGGMARICIDIGQVNSKYDCVLGANLHDELPVDRHIFIKRLRAWINADGFISPLDFACLAAFDQGPPATWEFVASAGDGRTVQVQMKVVMVPEQNSVAFRFSRPSVMEAEGKQLPASAEVKLTLRFDIEDRNFHQETKCNGGADFHFASNCRPLPEALKGFEFVPDTGRRLQVRGDSGAYHPQPEWSHNIPHPLEQTRGQEGYGDAYSPGWFEIPLPKDSTAIVTASAETEFHPASPELFANESGGGGITTPEYGFETTLRNACEAFLVRRGTHMTVIAGYPWFLDWGRDTLICARGLLSAGKVEEVKQLLVTFAKFEDRGTLPNTIHGEDASNRDTSDAPLWFAIVLEELARQCDGDLYGTEVDSSGRTFLSTLRSIGEGYLKGTPNGIRMDPVSKLIWSPSHFTWMDTNHPACTPREGYPVEIQALWVRLLRHLGRVDRTNSRWNLMANEAMASVETKFWLEDQGWFSDVLLAGAGESAENAVPDDALRSNCLFLISLGLVAGDRARKCVRAARRHLAVPGALRTLANLPVSVPLNIRGPQGELLGDPHHPYRGTYEGDEDARRKPAYHNGSAWVWTFPSFCEAMARAWEFSPEATASARACLSSIGGLLTEGCLGQLPELLDGSAPHLQRGCDAQAWSATEALRVWKILGNTSSQSKSGAGDVRG